MLLASHSLQALGWLRTSLPESGTDRHHNQVDTIHILESFEAITSRVPLAKAHPNKYGVSEELGPVAFQELMFLASMVHCLRLAVWTQWWLYEHTPTRCPRGTAEQPHVNQTPEAHGVHLGAAPNRHDLALIVQVGAPLWHALCKERELSCHVWHCVACTCSVRAEMFRERLLQHRKKRRNGNATCSSCFFSVNHW